MGRHARNIGLISAVASVGNALFLNRNRGATSVSGNTSGYRQVLHNFQNMQYYADFDIGGQEIAGIFDTGSFELLVRSTRCEHCAHPTPAYNHVVSKSYVGNGTVTKHVFGSGPCVSVMGYETVSVGPDLHAKEQAFWEILDHRIPVLDTAKFAAIVGIGPNFAYGNKEQTLLMSFGVDEFSVCLQKASGSEGYLTWGPEDTDLKNSDYASAKVHGKHHWAAKLTDVYFPHAGDNATTLPCGAGAECSAIIDSGTSLIAAPTAALAMLSQMIPPIAEDCSNLHELPPLRFVIDGNALELPPQAYVMRVTGATLEADDIWDVLFFKPKIRKLNMCMPAFMQIDMASNHGPVWILGMPFFRYYHTTFDRKNEVMRFSVAGPDCMPLPYKAANANKTASMLSVHSDVGSVLDVDLRALVPPTLSEMIDYKGKESVYKFNSDGKYLL